MSAEVARLLRDAADLLEPKGRWTTQTLARDTDGVPIAPTSRHAVCWCAEGALARVDRGLERLHALDALAAHLGTHVGLWNDVQQSAEPVIAALHAAADEVEAS